MSSYKELLRFIGSLLRRQKGIFALIFLIDCFAWPVDSLLWPYILHWIIDIFSFYEGNRLAAWEVLQGPIIVAIILVTYVEIASRSMGFLMAKALPNLQAHVRMAMFSHIQRHPPRYFNEKLAGSLANKITELTNQVDLIIQQFFWPIIPALAGCIFGSLVLGFMNPLFAAILMVWIAIHMSVCLWFARSVVDYEQTHAQTRSTLLGRIVDSLTNNFTVNLFYRFRYEEGRIEAFQEQEKRAHVDAKRYLEIMRCIISVFYFSLGLMGMNGAIVYLWLHDHITTGQVIQVFTTMCNLGMIMWTVSSTLPVVFQSIGIAKQAYSLMMDPQDMGDLPRAKELEVNKGEIIFDQVSFQYGEKKIFENKQVHIQAGERVGLVGYTGSGKSTFINLILRLFPLEKGRILIDGQDIAKVTCESLRSQIALIPQDPILFHRSLRENIAYGKVDANEQEIFEAAKLSHCDDFIRDIPGGYEAKVGERGTKLSGGEKQRIGIARAILVDASIFMLDEATSALDSLTERSIQENLEKLMEGRTTLIIAHRLSTLARLDRILVFDKGQIVEEGSHSDLLSKKGLYEKMWNMQIDGFLPETPSA